MDAQRIVHWAASVGLNTKALVEAILADRPHPEMGHRSCLGILRLGKKYHDRLDAACARALAAATRAWTHSEAWPRSAAMPSAATSTQTTLPLGTHENVRGPDYYH